MKILDIANGYRTHRWEVIDTYVGGMREEMSRQENKVQIVYVNPSDVGDVYCNGVIFCLEHQPCKQNLLNP